MVLEVSNKLKGCIMVHVVCMINGSFHGSAVDVGFGVMIWSGWWSAGGPRSWNHWPGSMVIGCNGHGTPGNQLHSYFFWVHHMSWPGMNRFFCGQLTPQRTNNIQELIEARGLWWFMVHGSPANCWNQSISEVGDFYLTCFDLHSDFHFALMITDARGTYTVYMPEVVWDHDVADVPEQTGIPLHGNS